MVELDRTEAEVATIVVDGILLDAETGEILGMVNPPAGTSGGPFVVDSEGAVRWVLERIRNREAAAYAAENDAAVVAARATLAASDAIASRERKAAARLRERFGPEVQRFVEAELERQGPKAGRSVQYIEGKVKLTSTQGRLKVRNATSALVVARALYPDAIKREESFQISALTEVQKTELEEGLRAGRWQPDDTAVLAFEVTADATVMRIETGVPLS